MDSNLKTDELSQTILRIVDEKSPDTLRELMVLVQKNTEFNEKEILEAILKLKAERKINLTDYSLLVISNLSSYLKSNQALWFWITVAIALLTLVFAFLINEDFYPWNYIRNVLGLIFVLWLPGYSFIKTLFPVNARPTKSSANLGNAERIALSIIMSLALVALIGLALNFTPWGINLTTIVISLLVFSLVFSTAAVVREYLFARNI